MEKLKLAILGSGFWAAYQLAAWMEFQDEVEIVALCDRTISKANKLAEKYNVPHCYSDIDQLLEQETLDFVDIITDVGTHAPFTKRCATQGIPVICQKPMADGLSAAHSMLHACNQSNIPLFIHENFRWQKPIRTVKALLDKNIIGTPFKARVSFCSAFPVFENQPFLAELKEFILTDIGSHILDVCRFLFGEVKSLYCQTATITAHVKGEDVANVFMKMKNNIHCFAEMSYASILEEESFPHTLMVIEGDRGSIYLGKDYKIKVVTREGADSFTAVPKTYEWADPVYTLAHSSIVDCNRNILNAIQGNGTAETTGEDNLKTTRLVWAAYQSAKENKVINLQKFHPHKTVKLS